MFFRAVAGGRDCGSPAWRRVERGGGWASRYSARQPKDAAQARRLLAIAAVLEGASREDAAEIAEMDRQTLRDWVIRFNERGPDRGAGVPQLRPH
jgi:hypothetical protein